MLIEGTKNTPSVRLGKGILEIKGRSIPEDAHEFFNPIINELQSFSNLSDSKLEVFFHLEYINSGSKKYISNILGILNQHYLDGKDIMVFWNFDYDDDSIEDLGNDFRTMFQIPIQIKEMK
jgi:hypothetical protein